MARIAPWHWTIWGPWPPSKRPLASEEEIRRLAEQISHQKPWQSAEENWLTAEHHLRSELPLIPVERIRTVAQLISQQRPWQTAEENWLSAEHVLQINPSRSWIIRFSGEKERSGWDWTELLLKVSVPVLILALSTAYSTISSNRQEKIVNAERARQEKASLDQMESDAVTEYIREMKPLLLEERLKEAHRGSEVIGAGRALTLATLARLRSQNAPMRRTIVMRFLIDSGISNKGDIFNFAGANLGGADLSDARFAKANLLRANLEKTTLADADLSKAFLVSADLSNAVGFRTNLRNAWLIGANLSSIVLFNANLSGALLTTANLSDAKLVSVNLRGADLSAANLKRAYLDYIEWDDTTKWPSRSLFEGAKKLPDDLKKKLGL